MRSVLLAVVALVGIAVAGCDSTPAAAPPKSKPTGSRPAPGGLDPCRILDTAMRGSGYPPGKLWAANNSCATGTKTGSIGFDVRLLKPGADNTIVNGGHHNTNVQINGRPSVQTATGNACTITLPIAKDITKVQYASALVTYQRNPAKPAGVMCRSATQLATKIDTQLPSFN